MNLKNLIAALHKRKEGLEHRIAQERKSLDRLRHKSRTVRQNSRVGPRINYFSDKLNELALVIEFANGRLTLDEFVKRGNGDEADKLISALCGGSP